MRIFPHRTRQDPVTAALRLTSKKLAKVYHQQEKSLAHSTETFPETQALHSALRSLREIKVAIDRALCRQEAISAQTALSLLREQGRRIEAMMKREKLTDYLRASEVSIHTMNLLF